MKQLTKFLATLHIFLWPMFSSAQGTITITFDYPSPQPPGTAVHIQQYSEAGFSFTPIPSTDGFVRQGGGVFGFPENGTTYLQATLGDSLTFSFSNFAPFSLVSVDLAGYSDVVPDVTAYFVGYRSDGSTVTTSFQASGINFQTYYFGSEWSGLTRVEVPDFGSLDNLVVVPEPGTGALLVIGAVALACRKMKRRK